MPSTVINNGDLGLAVRNAINTNFLNHDTDLRRAGAIGKRNSFIMTPATNGASIVGLGGTIGGGGTLAQVSASASPTTPAELFNRTSLTTSASAGNTANYRGSTHVGYNSTVGYKCELNFTSGSSVLTGRENYIGTSSNTSTPASLASLTDFLGMIKEAGDTNWFFAKQTGSGAFSKVDLGIAVTAGQVFQLEIISLPQNAGTNVRIVQTNLNGSQTVVYDALHTTGLAGATAIVTPHVAVRNGAVASTATISFISGYAFAL